MKVDTVPTVFLSPVTCPACGWRGVPTILNGEEQTKCPCPGCPGQLDLSVEFDGERFTTERKAAVFPVPRWR